MPFSEERFWKFIDNARAVDENLDAVYEVLADQVWRLEPEELIAFQRILEERLVAANTAQLWQAAQLRVGEITESIFLGFRCWLLSRGKAIFNAAVAQPDSIAGIPFSRPPLWGNGEQLLHLAGKAWMQWSESDATLSEEIPTTGTDVRTPPDFSV